MTLTIDVRHNGPPDSGNGGYVAGRMAEELSAARARPTVGPDSPWVEVTLRTPPPLAAPYELALDEQGVLTASLDRVVIAQARMLTEPPADSDPVLPVDVATARAAEHTYAGLTTHPFPTCWVCGPARPDGYHLQPGMVDRTRTACVWHVPADAAPAGHGPVPASAVWAALDCPGGWAALAGGEVVVLGRIAAVVASVPDVGEDCLVMGQLHGRDGRKLYTTTTVYRADGTQAARARSTWITITLP